MLFYGSSKQLHGSFETSVRRNSRKTSPVKRHVTSVKMKRTPVNSTCITPVRRKTSPVKRHVTSVKIKRAPVNSTRKTTSNVRNDTAISRKEYSRKATSNVRKDVLKLP